MKKQVTKTKSSFGAQSSAPSLPKMPQTTPMSKMRSESYSYDSNRPKKQVVSRYKGAAGAAY